MWCAGEEEVTTCGLVAAELKCGGDGCSEGGGRKIAVVKSGASIGGSNEWWCSHNGKKVGWMLRTYDGGTWYENRKIMMI